MDTRLNPNSRIAIQVKRRADSFIEKPTKQSFEDLLLEIEAYLAVCGAWDDDEFVTSDYSDDPLNLYDFWS